MKALPYDKAVAHVRSDILSSAPLAPMTTIMRCVYPGKLSCDWHSRSVAYRSHAILALSGGMVFQERGRRDLHCGPGSVIAIPKGIAIRWETERETALLHCLHGGFDFKSHGTLATLFGPLQERMALVEAGPELPLKIERRLAVAKAARTKDIAYSLVALEFLWAALEAMRSRPDGEGASKSHVPLVRCLDYIESNLERSITLEDLMRVSSLGASRLSQLFRENIGTPPLHYVARRKMEIAARLLSLEGVSIGDVAARLGFSSLSYFSRVFKRQTGQPPSSIIAKK